MVPTRKKIRGESSGRYKVVRKEWFAYDPSRLNTGSIAKWSGPGDALAPPEYVVFKCDESLIDPEFLNQFRLSHQWTQFVEKAGRGSVRMRVQFSDLAAFKLSLPPIEEQQRIAAALNSCDREGLILKRQLDALKRQERGLMQKLLTGQTRVNNAILNKSPV
jgi:type I restriction enzyme S subunit